MNLTRRRLLSVAGAAGLGTGLSGCSSPVSLPGGSSPDVDPGTTRWTYEFEDRPSRPLAMPSGVYAGDGTELVRLTSEGEVDWRVSADDPFQGRPLRVGDRVLAVSGEPVPIAGAKNTTVHSVTADGEREWREPVGGGGQLSLLDAGGGVVYAGTADDAIDDEGQRLFALALDDGTVEWNVECGDVDRSDGVATDDTLYLRNGPVEAYAPGGERLWGTDRKRARPLVLDESRDQLYVGSPPDDRDTHLQALAPDDGELLWDAPAGDGIRHAALHGDHVVLWGFGGVYAVSRSDGSTTWQRDHSWHGRSPAISDGTAYLAHDGTASAIDIADGEELWSQSLPDGESYGTPAVGETVVCTVEGEHETQLIGLDTDTGDEMWRETSEYSGAYLRMVAARESTLYTYEGVYQDPNWPTLVARAV